MFGIILKVGFFHGGCGPKLLLLFKFFLKKKKKEKKKRIAEQ
jgi:hypothetical protein